jgi:hypothetical protein
MTWMFLKNISEEVSKDLIKPSKINIKYCLVNKIEILKFKTFSISSKDALYFSKSKVNFQKTINLI